MSRRRKSLPSAAPAVHRLDAGFAWRDLVADDADLDRLAERLHRFARWTCAASPLDASTIHPPSGSTGVSLDTIDAWLAEADANDGGNRRGWAWRRVLAA